jgi:hypothetical protein
MTTVTLDEAQKSFDSLAQRALDGESILIQVDGRLLSLKSVAPDLPDNYLASCYGPQEIAEEDYLASLAPRGTSTGNNGTSSCSHFQRGRVSDLRQAEIMRQVMRCLRFRI